MPEKKGKAASQVVGVICIALGIALALWARSHSPHMGFMEMMGKADSFVLKEPVYNVALIVAALLGLLGVIRLVQSFLPGKSE